MFEPEVILGGLESQIEAEIGAIKKAKNLEDKLVLSKIIKNLVQSHTSYIEVMANMMGPFEGLESDDFDEEEFEH